MENNIKYICESCGKEPEFVLDTRTDNSRYDGTLVHTVPVCSCLIDRIADTTDMKDYMDTINHMEKVFMSIKKEADSLLSILEDTQVINKKEITQLIKGIKNKADANS